MKHAFNGTDWPDYIWSESGIIGKPTVGTLLVITYLAIDFKNFILSLS
jgi:hypothetical protein